MARVPPAYVKEFRLVIEATTDVIEREQFEENVVPNKKRLFVIETWNQYDASGDGAAQIKNGVEG